MIYKFYMTPSDETYGLVVSGIDEASDYNEYQKWKEKPDEMITDLIRRDLVASGLFRKAVGQSSNIRYRYALEGQIWELNIRMEDGAAVAHLKMDITLIDFEAPLDQDRNIFKKKYKVTEKCKDTKPESLVKGLNEAVEKFSERLRADIRKTLGRDGHDQKDRTIPEKRAGKAISLRDAAGPTREPGPDRKIRDTMVDRALMESLGYAVKRTKNNDSGPFFPNIRVG